LYDVFVPGDYFYDLIYTGLTEFPMLGREIYSQGLIATGGGLYITAASLQRLGVRVGWSACFGNDYYSQHIRNLAEQEGVDLSLAKNMEQPYRRVTTSIPYQGERAFVTYQDKPPCDLHAFWLEQMQQHEFRHLHLGGLMSIEQLKPMADLAHARGATVSMDCQDVPDLKSACVWSKLLGLVIFLCPMRGKRS
jgi:sugar/nucleoside kinase (ribokinase family)